MKEKEKKRKHRPSPQCYIGEHPVTSCFYGGFCSRSFDVFFFGPDDEHVLRSEWEIFRNVIVPSSSSLVGGGDKASMSECYDVGIEI